MGRRIVKHIKNRTTRSDEVPTGSADLEKYWDRLKNLIPAEVSAIYIAGLGVVPKDEQVGMTVWASVCVIFTAMFIARQSRTLEGKPNEVHPIDWVHVGISVISFIIWIYVLGGPFAFLGIHIPWIGTLLMLGWTFLVPYLYEGTSS